MKNKEHKEWSMLLGRYQCLPCHEGHCGLIYELLKQGKNVCVALRKEDGTEINPYTQEERAKGFRELFKKEIAEDRLCIINVPDIIEICHGRKVGWSVQEIKLSPEIEAISGTQKREDEKGK